MLAWFLSLVFVVSNGYEYKYNGCVKYKEYDSIDEYYEMNADGDAATLSKRVNMTDAMNNDGAVCIDGSVPVFYWRKGKGDGVNKFVIYFDGGGWCGGLDEDERISPCQDTCVHRAYSQFGTSSNYQSYMDTDKGCMSSDYNINPLSYNWNVVLVKYCDGSSYNGNNETVIRINSSLSLHFRGWRILNGLFKLLRTDEYRLNQATDVIVGGCSAGGLNIYMHIDYIYDTFIEKDVTKNFMGLIDSGFFMQYEGKGKYISAMQWLWNYMNMTDGLNTKCMQYYTDKQFECMFAANISPFIGVRVFNMQSRYDEWQQICELQSFDVDDMNEYGINLTNYYSSQYENANGNNNIAVNHGAFLDSCTRHCDNGGWYNITIDGYNQSQAMYQFYYNQNKHSRIWFQNDTYPCNACCP